MKILKKSRKIFKNIKNDEFDVGISIWIVTLDKNLPNTRSVPGLALIILIWYD